MELASIAELTGGMGAEGLWSAQVGECLEGKGGGGVYS
jgi:hypothetical protein